MEKKLCGVRLGVFSDVETRSKQLADAHCDHKEKLLTKIQVQALS